MFSSAEKGKQKGHHGGTARTGRSNGLIAKDLQLLVSNSVILNWTGFY